MSFLNPNLAAPSPTPSNSSANGAKRKRPAESSNVVYSQPADTGTGDHVYTQFGFARDHLKDGLKTLPFEEIMDYLGVREDQPNWKQLRQLFHSTSKDNRIGYDASTNLYHYRPKLNIRNAQQLKGYLQNQKSAQGISIKDLKDGWANVAEEIKGLADKKQVLLKYTKDGIPKTVWDNDPSLMHPMDTQFIADWHKIAIPPNPDDMRNTLLNVGLNVATAPRVIVDNTPKPKKKRAPRKNGRVTNTHMAHVLKDFSGLRK
jgi:transcription initiation factor TFIIE subunit beta